MVRSCVFCLLAIALCFVAFVCAHAEVSQHTAEEAVRKVKELTNKAVKKAQKLYTDAEDVKPTMDARKVKAQNAASEAKEAAKDNAEAIEHSNEAKSALEELIRIYDSAKEKAQKAVEFTKDVLAQARVLDGKSKIPISPNESSVNNYSKVSANAADVKNKTQELEKEIQKGEQLLSAARAEMLKVSECAEKAQIAKHRVDAVVTVAKIKTLVREADTDVAIFQEKSNEIKAIVQEIEGHLKTARGELMLQINNFHTKADSDLRRVTGLIKEVENAKKAIQQEKTNADKALAEMPDLTQESQVRQKAQSVSFFFNRAETELKKIKTARESAKSYADNSNEQKQNTLKALSPNNSKPGSEKEKETIKPSQTVDDVTTETTSEDTTEQKDTNPGQPSQDAMTKVTSGGTKEQKELKLGQYIEKDAKRSAIKGKASPHETNNDSAVTVSFSLLLALIVCANLN